MGSRRRDSVAISNDLGRSFQALADALREPIVALPGNTWMIHAGDVSDARSRLLNLHMGLDELVCAIRYRDAAELVPAGEDRRAEARLRYEQALAKATLLTSVQG